MYKIPCASQNTKAKNLPADVCIFGRFGQRSTAAVLSADCRFDSWIHDLLLHIYAKTLFLLRWNSYKQRSELSTGCCFCFANVAKWWINCPLISSTPLLSDATSIDNQPKCVRGGFWCFPRELPNLRDLNVQHNLCLYDYV